jgi:Xaa-Pro aminopeptidase
MSDPDPTPQPGYPRFSADEFERRNALARDLMKKQDLQALVLFGNSGMHRHNQANVFWLTNYLDWHHAYLVFPLHGEPTLFNSLINHVPNARLISVIPDTRWGTYEPAKEISAQLQKLGIHQGRVGLVSVNATFDMGMPYQHFATLRSSLPDVEWVDVTRDFARLRFIKSEEEFAWLKIAAEFTDDTVAALEEKVTPGMTEHELIAIIEGAYRGKGGQPHLSYLRSMPMHAPTACVPSQNVTNRVIQRGDVIIMEISASYWGYSGQIQRPIAVAADPTPEWQKLFDIGLQAYEKICAVMKPGANEGDVTRAASLIGEAGYRIYDDLIHGFGVDIQPPLLDQHCAQYWPTDEKNPAPAGRAIARDMAVVVQPNPITPDERMGLQVGGLTRVTDAGAVSLQQYPLKFVIAKGR